MKRKLLLHTVALITGTLLAGSAMAQTDPTVAGSRGDSALLPPTSIRSHGVERISQLTGATITDSQGNSIGQINDFIVSPASGRIHFAVISLADQSGKLTAVPWSLIRPGTDATSYTLNVDKQKLSSAQTFDSSSWPDFNQPQTAQQINTFYGVQPGRDMGGRLPGGDIDSGSGSDTVTNSVSGTQPDGKGTLKGKDSGGQ